MKLFVEGGGESVSLKSRCRAGFTAFLKQAGVSKLPRIVASGSRNQAFQDFCKELNQSGEAMLLVDSEGPVTSNLGEPWEHLLKRDNWGKPQAAEDEHCHLMVVCMEAWFLADRARLKEYFGKDFQENALPRNPKLEEVSKSELFPGLTAATKRTKKGSYSKGEHSFCILEGIDPQRVCKASPWAARFVEQMKASS